MKASTELSAVARTDPLAKRQGCARVKRLQLVEHACALGDGGAVGDEQRRERLACATGTRRREPVAREHLPRRQQRVDLIGLAAAAVLAAWPLDLDDLDPAASRNSHNPAP